MTRTRCCSRTPPRSRTYRALRFSWRHCASGARCRAEASDPAASPSALHRLRPAGLLAAALLAVGPLGHHHPATEGADHRAVLLVADGLDRDDPAVVLRLRLG